MKRRFVAWAARLSLGFTFAMLAPTDVQAQGADAKSVGSDPSVEASERFRRGVKLHKAGEHTAALVEFKKAYELVPNYGVLYNLGQTSRELKDYAFALTSYERYLEEGGKEISAARKKEVAQAITELNSLVGALKVTCNVDGAEIFVDDVSVGFAPLADPVVVNIGKRLISATKSRYSPTRRSLEVGGKETVDVKLELELVEAPIDPNRITDPRPVVVPPEPEGPPVAAIVMVGVTGASAIVMGIFGGLALSAQSDLDAALAAFPGDAATIEDAQSRTRSMAIGTDVMIGVTAASGGTAAVLFILALTSGEDEKAADDTKPTEEPEVTFLPGWLGGAIHVGF